jgi:hypothetical protein
MAKYIFLFILFIMLGLVYIILYIKSKYIREPFETFEAYNLPRTIWIYWDQAELPNDINAIIKNNKNVLDGWTINLLNSDNLNTYLDTTSFPKNYDKLSVQHRADLIRLRLLKKNGGVWMDASIIINSKEDFEKLFNQCLNTKVDLMAFTLGDKDYSYDYHQYIENWFLIAPQNSQLINLWLIEYEKAIDMDFDKYMEFVKRDLHVKLCESLFSDTYLTQHIGLQTVLQKKLNNFKPTILLKRSEDTMFKLPTDCGWDKECIKNKFNNHPDDIKKIPYLKFTGFHRGFGMNFDNYFT